MGTYIYLQARGRFFTNKKANGLIESTICIYNNNNTNNNNNNNDSNSNNNNNITSLLE